MKYITTALFIQLFIVHLSFAQVSPGDFFQGYKKTLHGFPFTYHSPLPEVNTSLIVRANKDFRPIEWETEMLPEKYNKKQASFIWAYGMDTDVKSYNFDLYVNDEKYFSFTNPVSNDKSEWAVKGKNGAVLTFHVTVVDKYKDQMGFAVLTLPRSALTAGKPVRLKMDGEDSEQGRIWYMTFKAGIYEKMDIQQEKVVLLENGRQYHVARFDFTHLGEKSNCEIKVGNTQIKTILHPGYNSLEVNLPKAAFPQTYIAKIKIKKRKLIKKVFTMFPVKEWTVYLVQHTHTDIGYTRPQTEILPEHLRYIDYALDFCDQTDDYLDDARFRWTCEASWAVREYLKSRPKNQIDRLIKRIDEGRIEVTGMFFNFSDIIDEAGLAAQTKTISAFKDKGINVTTVMQNDVNGIGWCLAEYLEGVGVKYLTMGQHGHRARIPFDKPTAFWWESPSGKRLLSYRSEHYMHGNTLGLISGDINAFKTRLSDYLSGLEEKHYPFTRTAFQFSGYITDNSPPSTIACEMVKAWNAKYVWPKLRLAIDREFMEYVEENHADELPVQKVAWPDWWTDGAGSAMLETKATRNSQSEMIANTGLMSMTQMMGIKLPKEIHSDMANVQDALLFYDEHTYGADQSISDPLAENSVVQWNEKSAYAWEAVKRSSLLREKIMGFIQSGIEKSEVPSIAVFNTLNWNRSGLVTVFIDHEILPENKAFKLIDYQGNTIAAQAVKSRSDGTYWGLWVEDVPAMGYKLYRIEVSGKIRKPSDVIAFNNIFENDFYKLKIDKEKGGITSLFDKTVNRELLDTTDSVQMGQFIYETLSNRHQMERFTFAKRDTVYVPLEGERYYLSNVKITGLQEGSVWKSLYLKASIPGCADDRGMYLEIRLYNKAKRIELHFGVHKLAVTSPESIYIAFPFGLENSQTGFEAQGGTVFPGENQLEGTASDWYGIQNFAFVRSDDTQIVFGSKDVPLVQFGAINTGRFYYKHKPETAHIYSWVLNNYWTTNFKASQEGELKWSYFITSHKDSSNAFATKFAWGSRVPLLTRVFPAGKEKAKVTSLSLLDIPTPNLLLVTARPAEDGDGTILQLRETDGKKVKLNAVDLLKLNVYNSISEVNVLEEEIKAIKGSFEIGAFETRFLRLK